MTWIIYTTFTSKGRGKIFRMSRVPDIFEEKAQGSCSCLMIPGTYAEMHRDYD